jgi:hypothetical protein
MRKRVRDYDENNPTSKGCGDENNSTAKNKVLLNKDVLEFCWREKLIEFDLIVKLSECNQWYRKVIKEKMEWKSLVKNDELLQLKTFDDVVYLYNNIVCRVCGDLYAQHYGGDDDKINTYKWGLAKSGAVQDWNWIRYEGHRVRICESCYYKLHPKSTVPGSCYWILHLLAAYPEFKCNNVRASVYRDVHISVLRRLFLHIVNKILYSRGFERDQDLDDDIEMITQKLVNLLETEGVALFNVQFGCLTSKNFPETIETFVKSKLMLVFLQIKTKI